MGIVRLLTILFILWLIYALYKRLTSDSSSSTKPDKKPKGVENVVKCQHCGIHIPQREAIESGGRYYCSQAHLDSDVTS